MALVTRFDTPASLRDLPAGSVFYDNWHAYLAGSLAASTPGSGGGEFYDASEVDVNVLRSARLSGWPSRAALMVATHRDDRRAAFVAGEVRDVQNEYCEWRVTRNAAGKITKVVSSPRRRSTGSTLGGRPRARRGPLPDAGRPGGGRGRSRATPGAPTTSSTAGTRPTGSCTSFRASTRSTPRWGWRRAA